METKPKKHIAIISTGGTIAGSGRMGEAATYRAGTLSVESILSSVSSIQELADLEVFSVCSKDSNDITEEDLFRIKVKAEELEQDDRFDGIVITHGTDTLEETAFFLNLVLNVSKPIVMTGAMRPATATSADGPMNLYQAVALAANPKAEKMGVLAVLSDTIYSGRDLTKVNSIKTDAFEVGDPGPIGYMQDDKAYLIHAPYRRHTIYSRFAIEQIPRLARVEIYYVHAQSDPDLLAYMLETYDGVIIAGSGSGNYSQEIREVIENYTGPALIVRTSRLLEGAAFESPVFDPLKKTIPAHRLSPHKARILTQLALSYGVPREEMPALFREY